MQPVKAVGIEVIADPVAAPVSFLALFPPGHRMETIDLLQGMSNVAGKRSGYSQRNSKLNASLSRVGIVGWSNY